MTERHVFRKYTRYPLAKMVHTNMQVIPAGESVEVEGYWDEVTGGSWMNATGNFAAMAYAVRSATSGLPIDDDVVYVKYDRLGSLVHVSEIDWTKPEPPK